MLSRPEGSNPSHSATIPSIPFCAKRITAPSCPARRGTATSRFVAMWRGQSEAKRRCAPPTLGADALGSADSGPCASLESWFGRRSGSGACVRSSRPGGPARCAAPPFLPPCRRAQAPGGGAYQFGAGIPVRTVRGASGLPGVRSRRETGMRRAAGRYGNRPRTRGRGVACGDRSRATVRGAGCRSVRGCVRRIGDGGRSRSRGSSARGTAEAVSCRRFRGFVAGSGRVGTGTLSTAFLRKHPFLCDKPELPGALRVAVSGFCVCSRRLIGPRLAGLVRERAVSVVSLEVARERREGGCGAEAVRLPGRARDPVRYARAEPGSAALSRGKEVAGCATATSRHVAPLRVVVPVLRRSGRSSLSEGPGSHDVGDCGRRRWGDLSIPDTGRHGRVGCDAKGGRGTYGRTSEPGERAATDRSRKNCGTRCGSEGEAARAGSPRRETCRGKPYAEAGAEKEIERHFRAGRTGVPTRVDLILDIPRDGEKFERRSPKFREFEP